MFGGLKIGHLFRCLCQNEKCRATLGAIHIPCVAGRVVFICHTCGTITEFKNGPDGFDAKVLGNVNELERENDRRTNGRASRASPL